MIRNGTWTSRASALSTKRSVGWAAGGTASIPVRGVTSGTTDGGATWFDANDVGAFLNRFRFFPEASRCRVRVGRHDLSMRRRPGRSPMAHDSSRRERAAISRWRGPVWNQTDVPANAAARRHDLRYAKTLVKVLADRSPRAPERGRYSWDFKTRTARTAEPAISSRRPHRRHVPTEHGGAASACDAGGAWAGRSST